MPEHQQIQQSKKPNTIFQKQATPVIQTHSSNPYSIIQRAKINPRSLTHADIMQLQRTIGNRAVGRLLSGIGNSSTAQQATVQRQEIQEEETCPSCVQRQEIPEEEEPLQGKFAEFIQRQEIPEEEEPLQGKMIETIQRQEIPEEEEPLQGRFKEPIQRQEIPEEEKPLQGKFENKPEMSCPLCFAAPIVQRQELEDEEKPLQGKMVETIQRQEIPEEEEPIQKKRENNTGMPDNLKAGVESLSGIDMSDVRVHYNSSKPLKVEALVKRNGTQIGEQYKASNALTQVRSNVSFHPSLTLYTGNPGIIQRTRWDHDGHQWVKGASSSTDTDMYSTPDLVHPHASLGDVYDQNTGVYTSPLRDGISAIGSSSGPIDFYDRRARTGFAYASGTSRQGPHTLAHITKRLIIGAAVRARRHPLKLIGSAAAPRPRRMNKMLRDRLKTRGTNWKKSTRKTRTCYISAYRRAYFEAIRNPSMQKRLDALRRVIELNPATVYNIGSGTASSSQMAGKGESRGAAADDITRVLDHPKVPTSSLGLKTMDTSGASTQERDEADRMTGSFVSLLQKDEVSSDSGDSESDSDIEDLDNP